MRSDLALKVIMDCRTDESCNLKRNLGFRLHDVINTKEQTVLKSIKDAFEGEDMQTQYSVLGYRIDLYFHKHKLAIEVDELGHADRNLSNEIERQKALEKELNYVFIRINPDEKNFNIFKEINKIHRHIKKSTEKSLIDDLSKRLLELEFKSNHSKKIKVFKMDCQKNTGRLRIMKNTQSKIKPIKFGKNIGTTYCLGCKDCTNNFKPQGVKMTNKMLREKSNCVVCRSSKSRFLKQKHDNKINRQTHKKKFSQITEHGDLL